MKAQISAIGLVALLGCGEEEVVRGRFDEHRPKVEYLALADEPVDTHRYTEVVSEQSWQRTQLCKIDIRKNWGEFRAIGRFQRCLDVDHLYSGFEEGETWFDSDGNGKVDSLYTFEEIYTTEGSGMIYSGACSGVDEQIEINTLKDSLKEELIELRESAP